jgi:hypothetical protein
MKNYYFFLFLFVFLWVSCDNSTPEPKNPLFSGTILIETTAPIKSISSNNPEFKWQSPGTTYEILGVFTNVISVDGKKIQNKNDCIAMWTTGLKGTAGEVSFSDFRQMIGGVIQGSCMSNLPGGGVVYHWAVWAYDDKMTITHSSIQREVTNN